MKETLEGEEATESGVTLSVTSSPDDITALVLHTFNSSRNTHFLPGLKLASLKRGEEQVEEERGNRF